MAIGKKLGKFGSKFALNFFLETVEPQIIKGLQDYLKDITPQQIHEMVDKVAFPSMGKVNFAVVSDNVDLLENIGVVRLLKYLSKARPDLSNEIQSMGMRGAEYLVKLRAHILNLIRKAAVISEPVKEMTVEKDLVEIRCDKCGESRMVSREEAATIDKCPACGE